MNRRLAEPSEKVFRQWLKHQSKAQAKGKAPKKKGVAAKASPKTDIAEAAE